MKSRYRLVVLTLVLALQPVISLVNATPARADYPSLECGPDSPYIDRPLVVIPSSEKWVCVYDPELEIWHWDPVQPDSGTITNTQGIAYNDGGDCNKVRAITENINGYMRSGAHIYTAYPCWSPYTLPPGYIATLSLLYRWNGSAWGECRNSGWNYNGGYTSQFTPTFFWNATPCGSGYYGSVGYGYHWNGSWKGGAFWSGYLYAPNVSPFAVQGAETARGKAEKARKPTHAPPVRPDRPPIPTAVR